MGISSEQRDRKFLSTDIDNNCVLWIFRTRKTDSFTSRLLDIHSKMLELNKKEVSHVSIPSIFLAMSTRTRRLRFKLIASEFRIIGTFHLAGCTTLLFLLLKLRFISVSLHCYYSLLMEHENDVSLLISYAGNTIRLTSLGLYAWWTDNISPSNRDEHNLIFVSWSQLSCHRASQVWYFRQLFEAVLVVFKLDFYSI